MLLFPNAKINLGLNILRKREDGYHDLSSCFYPIPLKDILEINFSTQLQFKNTGLEIPGDQQNNLVLKAFHLMKNRHGIDEVSMHLHKIVPMGAGLGGGSADAAFCLKGLNDLFELGLSINQLEEYALELGSDCPFFIQNQVKIAEGRGEQLKDINLKLSGFNLLLIIPPFQISTAQAYANCVPKVPDLKLDHLLSTGKPEDWRKGLKNDFEASLFPHFPALEQIKESLYDAGALYASMSGSGSTLYGIFDTINEEELPDSLKKFKYFILPSESNG